MTNGLLARATALVAVLILACLLDSVALAAEKVASCMGLEATIVGTDADDAITGSNGNDVIAALAGNDTIRGGGGLDVICGDEGDDAIYGRGHLLGGSGDDLLDGSQQIDYLYPGEGDDVVRAGRAGPGDGYNPDEVRYTYAAQGVRVDLPNGIATGEGTDQLFEVEDVHGSAHADVLIAKGSTRIVTGGGDDWVIGNEHPWQQLDFRSSPGPVKVNLAAGRASGWGNLTIVGIDDVTGSDYDDILVGGEGRNEIIGGLGSDVIKGGPGRDFLFEACNCGPGIAGPPPGFDSDGTVHGGPGNDWVFGTDGNNTLRGGPGKDLLMGHMGNDLLEGGSGTDTAHFGGYYDNYYTELLIYVRWLSVKSVTVDLAAGTARGQGNDDLTGIERVRGSDRDDTLIGDENDNVLKGLGGNDLLIGRGGDDVLDGGPFVDRCRPLFGPRRIDCEA